MPGRKQSSNRLSDDAGMFAPLMVAGSGLGVLVGEVALRPIGDSDLDGLFELMRDPESVWMVAFTAEDPDDRTAFDVHMAKVRALPEATTQGAAAGRIRDHRHGDLVRQRAAQGDRGDNPAPRRAREVRATRSAERGRADLLISACAGRPGGQRVGPSGTRALGSRASRPGW